MSDEPDDATWQINDNQTQQSNVVAVGGRAPTWPVVTIVGPARNPRLTHSGQGRAIRIDIDVQVGDVLEVDPARQTVQLNGSPRFETVRADNQWWQLAPGGNTLVYSRASSGLTGASSQVTVEWRDGWWRG